VGGYRSSVECSSIRVLCRLLILHLLFSLHVRGRMHALRTGLTIDDHGPVSKHAYRLRIVMENFRKFSQVKTFPTMFAHRLSLIFYRNIYALGYFYRFIYVFIVLSMFRETFRKFSSLAPYRFIIRQLCIGVTDWATAFRL
jgi:hypothetical protein